MSREPRYWIDPSGQAPPPAGDEFPALLPLGPGAPRRSAVSRRDFFRSMGISGAALAMACSRAPVREVVPLLVAPDDVVPGQARWYATTCGACPAACGVVAKTRDGRPIKLEGNDQDAWSRGGLCAIGQASVFSLYDASRARAPESGAGQTRWAALDDAERAGLAAAAAAGKSIWIVAPATLGPSGEDALAALASAYPTTRRACSELGPRRAIAEAHHATHGVRAVPSYRFDRARVVAGIDADFLGTWLSPVAFTRQWAQRRDPARMARHLQLEPIMTVTGAAADTRWNLAPSDVRPLLAALAARLGVPGVSAPPPRLDAARVDDLARELAAARGEALVVTGSDDVATQALAAAVNEALGATGVTVELATGTPVPASESFDAFLDALRGGQVGAAIFLGGNPAHAHPRGGELEALLAGVATTVATSDRRDETARLCQHLAPAHHFLEDWSDAEPVRGAPRLTQPAVSPLWDTRSQLESLLAWAGRPAPAHDAVRARWQRSGSLVAWDDALRAGGGRTGDAGGAPAPAYDPGAAARLLAAAPTSMPTALEVVVHASVALGDGRLGNNAWLHELPDPISKVTWGNVAAFAPATAAALGIGDGDVVEVTAAGAGHRRLTLPALVQPGTHPGVVAIAAGYGRTHAGTPGNGVGVNPAPLAGAGGASVAKTGRHVELARTQTQPSMEGRPLVREADLREILLDPAAGRPSVPPAPEHSMWTPHEYPGHRWAMAIDLNACTGCSACVVACQAENNIPCVGADEVRRRREMHWMRIDRYYAGDPAEPQVVHQPMLCQHCENAPCETVCPVVATVHSSEGLNQQVYNRCVGTRYCANNCPTKVRRFNWFDYPHDDDVARMVLNPDVVVRSRGVMEKCSLCVQRVQEAKALARRDGRPFVDGDARTACQQTCPAAAISFGDLNDPTSAVAKLAASGRAYRILEDVGIRPALRYLTRIRNPGDRA